MDSVTIGIGQGRVILVNNTAKITVAFSWRAADEVAKAMQYKVRGLIHNEPDRVAQVTVRKEGDDILIIDRIKGTTLLILPLPAALEVSNALKEKARQLEEIEKAETIALDQAILQRTGRNFGLTSNPKIQDRAGLEAAWNTDLRRYISASHLRQNQVGSPNVDKNKKETIWPILKR